MCLFVQTVRTQLFVTLSNGTEVPLRGSFGSQNIPYGQIHLDTSPNSPNSGTYNSPHTSFQNSATSMFDAPQASFSSEGGENEGEGQLFGSGYSKMKHVSTFNTFIICDGKRVAHVRWTYTQTWDSSEGVLDNEGMGQSQDRGVYNVDNITSP